MDKYKVNQAFIDSKSGNVKYEVGEEVSFTKERADEIIAHQKEPLIVAVEQEPEKPAVKVKK